MNVCTFVGRLGRDSEKKELGDNTVLNFSLASDVGYGDKKSTLWVNCAVWGKRAETLAQYLKKGTSATVVGQLSQRAYTDKEGAEKLSLELRVNEIDFQNPKEGGGNKSDDIDDNIPF